MKKLISLFLSAVMVITMLSAFSISAFAKDIDGGEIKLDETKVITVNQSDIEHYIDEDGEERAIYPSYTYSFTPQEDGYYQIVSESNVDPFVTLLAYNDEEDDYYELSSNDDSDELNFNLGAYLEEGITYYYRVGFYSFDDGEKCSVTLSKIDTSNIKSFNVIAVEPLVYYQGVDSYVEFDNEDNEFDYYNEPEHVDIAYELEYTDGTKDVYNYNIEDDDDMGYGPSNYYNEDGEVFPFNVQLLTNQYETPFSIGTNYFEYQCLGFTSMLPVEVKENPVTAISFEPAQPYIYSEDYIWICPSVTEEGNELTVTANGETKTYTYSSDEYGFIDEDGNELEYGNPGSYRDWDEEEWTIGTNYFYVELAGKTCKVPVEIIKSKKISTFTYEPAEGRYLDNSYIYDYEDEDGRTWYTFDYSIEIGEIITLNYADGTTKAFICNGYTEDYDEGYMAYVFKAEDGEAIIADVETTHYEKPFIDGDVLNIGISLGSGNVGMISCDITYYDTEGDHFHTHGEPVKENEKPATCTQKGSYDMVVRCTECHRIIKSETVVTPALGHKLVTDAAVPATFTAVGKTQGQHCSVCNEVIVPQNAVAMLASPSLSKVKKANKSFKANWKACEGVDGYEIQYSLKKNFKKAKKKTVKGAAKKSLKVKKLKSGKKYYVRIRAYKVINGKKVYSKWSAKKTVKVK